VFAGETPYAAAQPSAVAKRSERVEEAEGEGGVAKRPRRRNSTSEPRLERIVVGGQVEADAPPVVAPDEGGQPARKGWWQRKLGTD
jgi:hypothetical protein